MGIPDSLTYLLETCIQGNKQQLELDMEQLAGSKLGKEYDKTPYCHPTYLTYMQSISCEKPGWMSTSWNQDCWENINNLGYADFIMLMAEREEKLKNLLMKVK